MYLILVIVLIGGYLYLSQQVVTQSGYTLEQMQKDLESGRIINAEIRPNREVPTAFMHR